MKDIRVFSSYLNDNNRVSGIYSACEEIPYALFINGRHVTTVQLVPGDQKEYTLGFLLTEQYVSGLDQVESVRIEKNRISVITTNLFTSPAPKKTILSGCGGAVSYVDTGKLPRINASLKVNCGNPADISVKLAVFHNDSKVLVSAALWDGSKILMIRSDLFGDQAVDRLIGASLTGGLDLGSACCLFSGLVTSETVRKTLIAGIPAIITDNGVTDLAVYIAEENGMALSLIKEERLVFLSHHEKLICSS